MKKSLRKSTLSSLELEYSFYKKHINFLFPKLTIKGNPYGYTANALDQVTQLARLAVLYKTALIYKKHCNG